MCSIAQLAPKMEHESTLYSLSLPFSHLSHISLSLSLLLFSPSQSHSFSLYSSQSLSRSLKHTSLTFLFIFSGPHAHMQLDF